MTWNLLLTALSLPATGLAALYARWSAAEAKKANDIGRLNAVLALRSQYIALMWHQESMVEMLSHSPNGLKAVRETYANLDAKLREVGNEIDKQHAVIVTSHN